MLPDGSPDPVLAPADVRQGRRLAPKKPRARILFDPPIHIGGFGRFRARTVLFSVAWIAFIVFAVVVLEHAL
jgi:hypothetical protein